MLSQRYQLLKRLSGHADLDAWQDDKVHAFTAADDNLLFLHGFCGDEADHLLPAAGDEPDDYVLPHA